MIQAQLAYKTQLNQHDIPAPNLLLVECERLEDVENISSDEIDNYVCDIRRHEQHEHYLCDELEEDVF